MMTPPEYEQITGTLTGSQIAYLRGPERLKSFEADRDKRRLARSLVGAHQIFLVEYWDVSNPENDRQFWRCCSVAGSDLELACGSAICEGCVPSRFSGSRDEYYRAIVLLLNSLGSRSLLNLTSAADSFLMLEGQPSEADIDAVLDFNEKHLGIAYKEMSRRHFVRQFQQSQMLVIGQTFG